MGRYLPVAKRPTIKLTRVDGERFCAKSRFEIRRHTLCISRVSNRRVGAKEPPATAGDFIVGCFKQRRRTQTAKLGCGNNNRACPMIPSARNREVWGLLAAEPAFAFAGTRSRSLTVRSFGYEPPSCQYGGWTVAAVRRQITFCVQGHDQSLERKNAHFSP